MADNYQVNQPTTAGATFASDDIGGTHWPRVKVAHGADGSATDVSSASPMPVQLVPLATSGATPYCNLDLDETKVLVVGAAASLRSFYAYNRATAKRYVKVYDAASTAAVTVGTTAPKLQITMEADQPAAQSYPDGIAFASGIVIVASTDVTGAGSALGANDVTLNLSYR